MIEMERPPTPPPTSPKPHPRKKPSVAVKANSISQEGGADKAKAKVAQGLEDLGNVGAERAVSASCFPPLLPVARGQSDHPGSRCILPCLAPPGLEQRRSRRRVKAAIVKPQAPSSPTSRASSSQPAERLVKRASRVTKGKGKTRKTSNSNGLSLKHLGWEGLESFKASNIAPTGRLTVRTSSKGVSRRDP